MATRNKKNFGNAQRAVAVERDGSTPSVAAMNAKKWNGSHWIRPEKRLAIYLRDEFTCVYCGRNLHHAEPAEINLDHIICRTHGGSNAETNLVTSCKACNSSRGAKKIAQWADEPTRRAIRRQTRRSLRRPLALAKEIINVRNEGWN